VMDALAGKKEWDPLVEGSHLWSMSA